MQMPVATRRYQGRRRFGRAQNPDVQDPYGRSDKHSGPAVCPDCGAVLKEGRWQWLSPPPEADLLKCQACRRIQDDYPAGELRLIGPFPSRQRLELEALARHHEAEEKQDHPLNRIMNVVDEGDAIVITTTDIHLPRRIGQAVRRAYHGKLDVHYDPSAYFVRAIWNGKGRPA